MPPARRLPEIARAEVISRIDVARISAQRRFRPDRLEKNGRKPEREEDRAADPGGQRGEVHRIEESQQVTRRQGMPCRRTETPPYNLGDSPQFSFIGLLTTRHAIFWLSLASCFPCLARLRRTNARSARAPVPSRVRRVNYSPILRAAVSGRDTATSWRGFPRVAVHVARAR